jgi:alkaline phosphatase D
MNFHYYIHFILLFLLTSNFYGYASVISARIMENNDTSILITFPKELNISTVFMNGLTIKHSNVHSGQLNEEKLSPISWAVKDSSLEIKFSQSLPFSGIIQLLKKSGNWKYQDGSPIPDFSAVLINRSHLLENWSDFECRRWVGPNLWANRLQDWQIMHGKLECTVRDANFPLRTVHVITREVNPTGKELILSVRMKANCQLLQETGGLVGFIIGAGNGLLDYRAGAIVQNYSGLGGGLVAVLDYQQGQFSFRDNNDENSVDEYPVMKYSKYVTGEKQLTSVKQDLILQLIVKNEGEKDYDLTMSGWDAEDGSFLGAIMTEGIPTDMIRGSFGLVAHPGQSGFLEPVAFSDFRAFGSMLVYHPEREFGPIVGNLYSLNKNILKMSVQFMPVDWPGDLNDRFPLPLLAKLETRLKSDSTWLLAQKVRITQPEYLAHFRVENWDDSRDYEYRLVFTDTDQQTHYYSGLIRKDPVDQEELSFAAFTGMGVMGRRADARQVGEGAGEGEGILTGRWTPANVWFPHQEIVSNIFKQDPDLIFFTGDQIYENNPTRPDRRDRFPLLDYLYKWYLWYWAFRDLTRDRPCILQVDDHDVYAGNVWGNSGDLNLTGLNSDGGGYMMDPLFVRVVERTQCLHDPDPYPLLHPMKNSFGSYFGSLTYGGVSFAILEDRKFKTRDLDQQGNGVFLGKDQLLFLEEWASDWEDAVVKVAVSQSTYASTHTEWDGTLAKDFDTGGYPKDGRDRALRVLRKSGALIVCGDQHLATITRMGVENPGDAAWQFCVPAAGNIYWRWFFPAKFLSELSGNDILNIPDIRGDYTDAFGNYFQMIAVANPDNPKVMRLGRTQAWVPRTTDYSRKRVSQGDGYGLVTILKKEKKIRLECFPFDADLSQGEQAQFPGWPYTISFNQLEGRQAIGYLPELNFKGISYPVVEVVREPENELIYATRVFAESYQPVVFSDGKYSIRVHDSKDLKVKRELTGIPSYKKPGQKKIHLDF